jgi:hypothetical protein
VVDWLFDLKTVTEKLDNVLTGGTKQISSALVTQKSVFSGSWIHFTNGIGNGLYTFENQAVSGSRIEWYTREFPGHDPSWVSWRGDRGVGKKQLSLAAALFHQFASKGRA